MKTIHGCLHALAIQEIFHSEFIEVFRKNKCIKTYNITIIRSMNLVVFFNGMIPLFLYYLFLFSN